MDDLDGLVQEGRNSIANALELRLSCTNPSISSFVHDNNPLRAIAIRMQSWS